LTLSAFVQHKVLAKRLVAVAGKSINVRSFLDWPFAIWPISTRMSKRGDRYIGSTGRLR
jgi:hypothetical protein